MMRAALGLVFVLACAGCAANAPQQAAASSCPGASSDSTMSAGCPPQPGQLSVHMGGTVQVGMGVVR
jgi:hypothetical protein